MRFPRILLQLGFALALVHAVDAATRKAVVTDRNGKVVSGVSIILADGSQSTSTDSNGVAFLKASSPTGTSARVRSATTGPSRRIAMESGGLRVRVSGFDAIGRSRPGEPRLRPTNALQAAAPRALVEEDSLLVGWNNVVRAKVALTQDSTTISIDTSFTASQLAWNDSLTSRTITDARDGHVYRIARIGNATWMAENLAYDAVGSNLYDGLAENGILYGRHYTWVGALALDDSCAMNDIDCRDRIKNPHRGACPQGWHIPSESDWNQLASDAGGASVAGTRLKATTVEVDHWMANGVPILKSADPYGFRAIFAGWRYADLSMYASAGAGTAWWSTATEPWDDATYLGLGVAKVRGMDYMNNSMMDQEFYKNQELSVRCVLDP